MAFKNWKHKKAHNAWYGMKYRAVGLGRGRGRYVDPEWRSSFASFLSSVGLPSSKQQVLCLRDPEAGFYPGNCYWGSRQELQQYVAHARLVKHGGRMVSMSAAARELGIHRTSLRDRMRRAEATKEATSDS